MAIRTAPARLPLHAVLDAVEAWEHQPDEAHAREVGYALGPLIDAYGASGARLVVDAPPLPRLVAGGGSLAGELEPPADAPGVRRYELTADDGRVVLGTLWVAGAVPHSDLAARAVRSALDAAWARAAARAAAVRMAALDDATRAIAGELDLERVLQLIVDRVRPLVGARYAALGILEVGGGIEQFVTSGISREEFKRIGESPRGHGLLGLIVRENRSFRIADIRNDPRRYGFPPRHPVMGSFLGVPVPVKGRSVGNLYLTDKQTGAEFSEDDQRLVESFALHAGIAIETARLHAQVQRLAITDERERIGKDLHDGIIQDIYAVGLSLEDVPDLMHEAPAEAVRRVEAAIERLHLTITDIRNLIFGLQPDLLGGTTLLAGVATLVEEFRHNSTVDVELRFGDALVEPPANLTAEVLAILNEALSNVARHSRATRVSIEVDAAAEVVRLAVVDNGVGMTRERTAVLGHQGMRNMRKRTEQLGGRLDIKSRPGAGTRVQLEVPTGHQPASERVNIR